MVENGKMGIYLVAGLWIVSNLVISSIDWGDQIRIRRERILDRAAIKSIIWSV